MASLKVSQLSLRSILHKSVVCPPVVARARKCCKARASDASGGLCTTGNEPVPHADNYTQQDKGFVSPFKAFMDSAITAVLGTVTALSCAVLVCLQLPVLQPLWTGKFDCQFDSAGDVFGIFLSFLAATVVVAVVAKFRANQKIQERANESNDRLREELRQLRSAVSALMEKVERLQNSTPALY